MTEAVHAHKKVQKRSTPNADYQDMLLDSLEKILDSNLQSQQEVIKYQSGLIKNLLSKSNITEIVDDHFFNIYDDISREFQHLRDDLHATILTPVCPDFNQLFGQMAVGTILSLALNLVLVLYIVVSRW